MKHQLRNAHYLVVLAPFVVFMGAALAAGANAATPSNAIQTGPSPLHLKPGQELVLTNGHKIVTQKKGSQEIFGMIQNKGVRWFPAGYRIVQAKNGAVFLIHGQTGMNSDKAPNQVAPGLKGDRRDYQKLGTFEKVIAPTYVVAPTHIVAPTNSNPNSSSKANSSSSQDIHPMQRVMKISPDASKMEQLQSAGMQSAKTHGSPSAEILPDLAYPLQMRQRGPKVTQLQDVLAHVVEKDPLIHPDQANRAKLAKKFKSERANQYYGAATRDLVKMFQQAHNLKPTGQVDAATARALNANVASLTPSDPK